MSSELPIITAPDWDRLFSTALEQDGYFTTDQAREVGYSPQLIRHHIHAKRFRRVARGIYRLIHFPPCDHEELMVAWLWTGQQGIVGLESALALHGLSDILPSKIHMVVPVVWLNRRLRVPNRVCLHFHDVPERERQWHGSVPITSPATTLRHAALEHLSPELIHQAVRQGLQRGLFPRDELGPALAYLETYHIRLGHE